MQRGSSLLRAIALIGAATLGTGVVAGALVPATAAAATTPPRFDHIVVVMEENHSYADIIGSSSAPYINSLASQGASFTNSFAIEHPSEPNYLDLFSGSNQGVTDDSCPHTFATNNLGNELRTAGFSYTSYSESLPSAGSTVCTSGNYARKHNPSVNFSDLPSSTNQPFTSFPSSANYSSLPTVSFVDPNLQDDMHDGTIQQGDTWLQNNMDSYAQWAKTHNSLLVVTWDEDDGSASNQIPTLFVGANVTAGQYSEQINHFSVLRTMEDAYGLSALGSSTSATPITDVFSSGTANTVTVTNPGNQTGTAGTPANLQLNATDSANGQTLTYTATGLPAGLTISPSGLITGTPTTAGTTTTTVTATDTTNASGSVSFTWTINPATSNTVTVTNPGNQTGTAGTPTNLQLNATDSANGQTLTYTATGLPAGLTISPSGLITGTPTTAGTTTTTVTATDTTNASGSVSFTWTINPATSNTVTVTNPGNQTGTAGTPTNLQLNATDSANGQTLTYTATGLPAGLTISPSGLITGTPTTAGTTTTTVTATDTTNASGSVSFTWTVNPATSGCSSAGQKLGNPGFESGGTVWSSTSGVIGQNSPSEPAHSGTWDAWLDGYGTTHTDTLSQSVAVPSGCSTTLSFYLHIDTAETTTTTQYDKLTVKLGSTTLATFSNLNAASGYTLHSYNVSSFAGQTVTLTFTGTEDSELQTSFVVDDTAVTAS